MSPPPSSGSNGWRLVQDGAAPGAWNMAMDEALLEPARAGHITLRLYRWDPPCLSFGRNQPARRRYDLGAARARGIQLVRRPTGGRAVFHHREVTYAVTLPDRAWGGPRAAYLRIHRAVAGGLRRLGAPIDPAPAGAGRPPARPDLRACFREPAPGELTASGLKLVGSALWRSAGALLQHGSVLIHDDQHVAEELRLEPDEVTPERPGGSVGLADLLGRPPRPEEVASALVGGFERELGVEPTRSEPTSAELERARRREPAYAGEAWTWRR